MQSDFTFSKDSINIYIKELAKRFRKQTNGSYHAELIIVGGAAILINYNFRLSTGDIDILNPWLNILQRWISRERI